MSARFPETPGRLLSHRTVLRLPLVLLHVALGLPLTLICFLPGLRLIPAGHGMRLNQRAQRSWMRVFLWACGARLAVRGHLPPGPGLIVANHISWLDIVVLHAVWPMHLVGKAEIRRWPLVGGLAALAGTIFIERGRTESRRRVNRRLTALMRRGDRVGIFPEAGIQAERGVGRFHPRLFASAIRAPAPVVPVAIRYHDGRDLHDEIVFAPGQNLLVNFARLLARRSYRVEVMIGPGLIHQGVSRDQLAAEARQIVKDYYES